MFGLHRRYLGNLADSVCRRPAWYVLAALVITVLAVVFTVQELGFKNNRDGLIGRNSEYWRLYHAYAEEFRAEDDYVITVESDNPERNRATVDRLREVLLSEANNSPSDETQAQRFVPADMFARVNLDSIKPWYLYYLDQPQLEKIRDSLKDFRRLVTLLQADPTLATFFDAMQQMLEQMETASPSERAQMAAFLPTLSGITRQMGAKSSHSEQPGLMSPWASAFFSDEMIRETETEMRWNGYHAFDNGRIFMLLVHPPHQTSDRESVSVPDTIAKLRRIIDEVRSEHNDVTIQLTGEPVLNHDEMAASRHDAQLSTILTLLLCGLIFVVGFREWLRPMLGMVCIGIVVALSLGWATVWPGHLNMITVTFAVMIIGLGIDLTIQFIARYEEDLSRGMTREQAVRTAISQTGPSIITAGVTNAAAFFAMMLSGFRGTIELGFIAGMGLLMAAVVTMLVLPPLLLLIHRKRESTHIPAQVVATRIESWLLRRPSLVIGVCLAGTLASVPIFWQVRFDYNVLNLQSHGLESVDAEMRLLTAGAQSTIYAAVMAPDLDEARRLDKQLSSLPTVSSVASIVPLIPENQESKRDLVNAIKAELNGVQVPVPNADTVDVAGLLRKLGVMRLRANSLATKFAANGDATSAKALSQFSETLVSTRTAIQELEPEAASRSLAVYQRQLYAGLHEQLDMMAHQETERLLTPENAPFELRRVLLGRTGKLLLRVFPRENIWERPALDAFVNDLRSVAPQATGTPLGLHEFVHILRQGYRDAALWALVVISILILIDFRAIRATVLTLLPLLAGVTWMMAIMAFPRLVAERLTAFGWTGLARTVGSWEIPFNPANIMVLPLIVGIGVAYGIYVVQRFREDNETIFYSKSTGRAVVLSGLTTLVAFGSLIGGSHQGIRSLGLVMFIGVTCCLVASLVLLPALLEIARRKNWKV
jgi:hypothetical protein